MRSDDDKSEVIRDCDFDPSEELHAAYMNNISLKNNIRKKILCSGACVIAAFGTFSLVFGSLSASHVSFALLSTLKLALLVGFMSNPVGWIVLGCVTLVGLAGLYCLYKHPEVLTNCIMKKPDNSYSHDGSIFF